MKFLPCSQRALARLSLCGAVYYVIAWFRIAGAPVMKPPINPVLTTPPRRRLESLRSRSWIHTDAHPASMLITMFRNSEPTRGSGTGLDRDWVGGLTNSSSFGTWQLSALACTPDPNRQSERKWQQSGPISLRDAGWAGHTHIPETRAPCQGGRAAALASL